MFLYLNVTGPVDQYNRHGGVRITLPEGGKFEWDRGEPEARRVGYNVSDVRILDKEGTLVGCWPNVSSAFTSEIGVAFLTSTAKSKSNRKSAALSSEESSDTQRDYSWEVVNDKDKGVAKK